MLIGTQTAELTPFQLGISFSRVYRVLKGVHRCSHTGTCNLWAAGGNPEQQEKEVVKDGLWGWDTEPGITCPQGSVAAGHSRRKGSRAFKLKLAQALDF